MTDDGLAVILGVVCVLSLSLALKWASDSRKRYS